MILRHLSRLSPGRFFLAALLGVLPIAGCSSLNVDKKQSMESSVMPFSQGEVSATVKASLKTTWAAVQKTANELGMRVERLDYSPPGAYMSVRTTTGKRMDIHLKKSGFASTSVVIVMGAKGDELLEKQFLAKLENQL